MDAEQAPQPCGLRDVTIVGIRVRAGATWIWPSAAPPSPQHAATEIVHEYDTAGNRTGWFQCLRTEVGKAPQLLQRVNERYVAEVKYEPATDPEAWVDSAPEGCDGS